MVVGLIIVAAGVFVLMAGRDALIAVWIDKLFDGQAVLTGGSFRSDDGLFKASQMADRALGHTLTIWFFLGLSFIKLGIGFAIATIVQHLRATGQATMTAYSSAGVEGAQNSTPTEPWYGRWFPRLLFAGILVMGTFFVLTLWWDVNALRLVDAQVDGRTSGLAYKAYLMTDRVLGTIIFSGKFLGEGLLIFGILTGLATIIWHLSFQAGNLALLTRRALGQGGTEGQDIPRPHAPGPLLKLGIAGFTVMALGMPLALVHAGVIGWELGRVFEGSTPEVALRLSGALERIINPFIFMGLGILFFSIAFLLLTIIRYLRAFRQNFGDAVADLSGGAVPRFTVEPSLWPTRLVPPLAIFGIVVIGFFFFTMTAVRELNFNAMLTLQFAGVTDGVFQNALRLDRMLAPVIGATRFIGVISIMLGIGLALVTIVINLRATALLLPAGFSKLIPVARGEEAEEEEDLTVYEPMALAPWDLFRPLVAGAVVSISATLPIVILLAVFIHRRMEQASIGLGGPDAFSDRFETAFWATNLIGASWQPWMLFGMGIILFSIGRFFDTIVGFVIARRAVITEATEAIAEAVSSAPGAKVPA